jgi:5'-nucleotidase
VEQATQTTPLQPPQPPSLVVLSSAAAPPTTGAEQTSKKELDSKGQAKPWFNADLSISDGEAAVSQTNLSRPPAAQTRTPPSKHLMDSWNSNTSTSNEPHALPPSLSHTFDPGTFAVRRTAPGANGLTSTSEERSKAQTEKEKANPMPSTPAATIPVPAPAPAPTVGDQWAEETPLSTDTSAPSSSSTLAVDAPIPTLHDRIRRPTAAPTTNREWMVKPEGNKDMLPLEDSAKRSKRKGKGTERKEKDGSPAASKETPAAQSPTLAPPQPPHPPAALVKATAKESESPTGANPNTKMQGAASQRSSKGVSPVEATSTSTTGSSSSSAAPVQAPFPTAGLDPLDLEDSLSSLPDPPPSSTPNPGRGPSPSQPDSGQGTQDPSIFSTNDLELIDGTSLLGVSVFSVPRSLDPAQSMAGGLLPTGGGIACSATLTSKEFKVYAQSGSGPTGLSALLELIPLSDVMDVQFTEEKFPPTGVFEPCCRLALNADMSDSGSSRGVSFATSMRAVSTTTTPTSKSLDVRQPTVLSMPKPAPQASSSPNHATQRILHLFSRRKASRMEREDHLISLVENLTEQVTERSKQAAIALADLAAESSHQPQGNRVLRIAHFSDVADLESIDPTKKICGGASKFATKLQEIRSLNKENVLVLFSGNFLSGSLMSSETKGRQMVTALNSLGVHYGTFGPRDFDHGLKSLKEALNGFSHGGYVFTGSHTTWLSSNTKELDGSPCCGAQEKVLLNWNGVRIGIIGLTENPNGNNAGPPQSMQQPNAAADPPRSESAEFNATGRSVTVANVSPSANAGSSQPQSYHEDLFSVGERLAQQLKADGAELVIALTNARLSTDRELKFKCHSIDMVLGGRDGVYKYLPKLGLVKSGSNFEYLSEIIVDFSGSSQPGRGNTTPMSPTVISQPAIERNGPKVTVATHPILQSLADEPNLLQLTQRYVKKLDERMGRVIGRTVALLDPRPEKTHREEGLLTNFIANIMCESVSADIAIIRGCAVSGNKVLPANSIISVGDVFGWLPLQTKVASIYISGELLIRYLNSLVEEYSLTHGTPSFPHCSSSLSFVINKLRSPPEVEHVLYCGSPVQPEDWFTVAVEASLLLSRGPFELLPSDNVLVSSDNAVSLAMEVRDYFVEKKGRRLGQRVPQPPSQTSGGGSGAGAHTSTSSSHSNSLSEGASSTNRPLPLPMAPLSSRGDVSEDDCRDIKAFKALEFTQSLDLKTLIKIYTAANKVSEAGDHIALARSLRAIIRSILNCETVHLWTYDDQAMVLNGVGEESRIRLEDGTIEGLCCQAMKLVNQVFPKERQGEDQGGRGSDAGRPRSASRGPTGRANPRGSNSRSGSIAAPAGTSRRAGGAQSSNLVLSTLTTPIVFRGKVIGVVQSANKLSSDEEQLGEIDESGFSEHDEKLLLYFARQTAVQMHFISVYQALQQSEKATHALCSIAAMLQKLAREQSIRTMVLRITDCAQQVMSCDRASLFLVDQGKMWTVIPTKDFASEITIRLPVGVGVAGKAAQTGQMINVFDAYKCKDFNPDVDRRTGYRTNTILCIPLVRGSGDCIGVLQCINKLDGTVFNADDVRLAQKLANVAAASIENCTEIETLRVGDADRDLQILPLAPLGNVRVKGGWATVRRELSTIVSRRWEGESNASQESGGWGQEGSGATASSSQGGFGSQPSFARKSSAIAMPGGVRSPVSLVPHSPDRQSAPFSPFR